MFKNNVSDNKTFYINVLIGAAIGVAISLILLFGVAALMVVFGWGSRYASPLSSVCAAVGAFVGGYFSARKNGAKGLLGGLLVAAFMFIIISIVGGFVSETVSLMSLIRLVIIALAASIGGILGVNKSSKLKIV
ncbi:MAG: TIGR04086 family membrane protein [Ruminococcaceae bacterium]|nr:TIGR04086 family membrane protein [Oscillospiraceae bacterium]